MHDSGGKKGKLLPANAYTKLEPGEKYEPIVPASSSMPEVTVWSFAMAMLMTAVFAAAAVYIALRAGSGIEAAIPIAVAAIFFGRLRKKRSTILENVIVQSIGQASGVVAAGAAFVIPALYLNQINDVAWWQIFLACFIGGSLGVVLIIPLRKYFVADRHGELPFPEGTATTEILVSGESSGGGAGKILLSSFALGGLYDFLVETFHAWNPALTTHTLMGKAGEWFYKMRMEVKMTAIAALFGLGYIIGLKYAAIIFAGSVLAYLVMVPLVYLVGQNLDAITSLALFKSIGADVPAGIQTIGDMSASMIFGTFIKPIGIGAIAVAGIIGLIKMGKIIVGSVSLGFKGIGKKTGQAAPLRTEWDMKPGNVLLIQLVSTLLMGLLFFVVCMQVGGYGFSESLMYSFIGMLIAFLLCFLFTPVAAEAIAIVGVNPVSGMTLVTVVISSLVMAGVGLHGDAGIFIALIIGTAVCTALSTSGALISDFKIGYWIGATPRKQQVYKFAGLAVAALVVAMVIPIMDSGYHFLIPGTNISNEEVLPAPQANMIAAVVRGLMNEGAQPYLLYGLGGLIAILVTMAGIPTLAFALGMYLPISLTSAQLVGGFVAWMVARSGKTPQESEARKSQGMLIASGMMAGAAIFGIISAVMRLKEVGYPVKWLSIGVNFFEEVGAKSGEVVLSHKAEAWFGGWQGQGLGLLMFLVLIAGTYGLARWGAKMQMAEESAVEEQSGGES